jgi:hypothetical protein
MSVSFSLSNPGRLAARGGSLSSVLLQKCQGALVKLVHFFIDGRVSAPLEDYQFSVFDVCGHRFGKTGRSALIVSAERNQRWRLNLANLAVASAS